MKKNIELTMKDIAREFNTSVATVSRALKDSPRISEEKRRAIQEFAREHNFSPNMLAESLRNSRLMQPKIIGVIVPELSHYYFSTVLAGIEEEARARDYRIMVAQSNEKYEREVKICQSFYENRVCGIIVSQAKDTTKYDHFNQLLENGVPLVFYDRICTGVNADRVVVDDYQGAYNAVTHLIETGCKRIAFYGSPMTLEISKNRYNGYKDALKRHGLEPDDSLMRFCDNRSDAEIVTPELLQQVPPPRCIFRRQRRHCHRYYVCSQENGTEGAGRCFDMRLHQWSAGHCLRSHAHHSRAAWQACWRGGCRHPHRSCRGSNTSRQGREENRPH